MRYLYILMLGILLVGCNQMSSNIYPTSREITINTDSSRIFAQFLIKPAKVSIQNNLRYYWYYTDKISSNIGGYNGNLLNGNYRVLSRDNKLVVQGFFANGLMDGVWKYWYPNGNLRKIATWKKGILKGIPTEYDIDGTIVKSDENVKNDESVENIGDSTSTTKPWYKKIFNKNKH